MPDICRCDFFNAAHYAHHSGAIEEQRAVIDEAEIILAPSSKDSPCSREYCIHHHLAGHARAMKLPPREISTIRLSSR